MNQTRKAWWRGVRCYLALYALVFAIAVFAAAGPLPLVGWKFALGIAAAAAFIGTAGTVRIVTGHGSGRAWTYLERTGVVGIVTFELFHAAYIGLLALELDTPASLWARAASHAALAIAVGLASKRRPVVRRVRGRQ